MLNNDKFGKVTFNMDVKGNHYAQRYPAITMKGLVASIDYSDYTYEDITLDGEYKQGASTVTYRSTTKTAPYN